jgi:phosphomannomutase/phosphoglucomutase
MFPTPKPALSPNTYAYESEPMVKATGFREYDARWLFEKEINLMGVQALGMGLGTLIRQMGVRPEIVIGHDFSSYSASIKYALITGLLAAGCKVHDIGLAVTPMVRPVRPRCALRRHGDGLPQREWLDRREDGRAAPPHLRSG